MGNTPIDSLAHKVTNIDKRSVSIARRDKGVYKISMEKTYTLDEKLPKFFYSVKIKNHSDVTIHWAVWNLTAVKEGGKAIFSAPESWSNLHFLFQGARAKTAFEPYISFAHSLGIVDFDTITVKGSKVCVNPCGNYLVHCQPDYWLIRSFPAPDFTKDQFVDNNSQIEIWVDTRNGLFELEVLSPGVRLERNEEYTYQEEFLIYSPEKKSQKVDVANLKKVVGSVVNK